MQDVESKLIDVFSHASILRCRELWYAIAAQPAKNMQYRTLRDVRKLRDTKKTLLASHGKASSFSTMTKLFGNGWCLKHGAK